MRHNVNGTSPAPAACRRRFMVRSMHEFFDIYRWYLIGGPLVIVGAVVGCLIGYYASQPNDKSEWAKWGAVGGAFIGLGVGVGAIKLFP